MSAEKTAKRVRIWFFVGIILLTLVVIGAVVAAHMVPAQIRPTEQTQQLVLEAVADKYSDAVQGQQFAPSDFCIAQTIPKDAGFLFYVEFIDHRKRPVYGEYEGETSYYTGADVKLNAESGKITECDLKFMIID